MPTTLRAKCIIAGDASVGKSAISQVFHSDNSQFPRNYTMTTGVELYTKTLHISEQHCNVEFTIVDSSGKDLYCDTAMKHWDQPSMAIIVYDVTSETSFSSCEKWLERVKSKKPGTPLLGVLVASKTDLEERRVVSRKSGQEFAESKGLKYFECSAKEMQNVDEPFQFLAHEYCKLYQNKVELMKTLA